MTESQQRLALGAIAVEVAEVHGRATDAANREHLWGLAERENYEWFTAVFQEYQAGTGDASAIIGPLRQYLQARASHLQATYDLNVALAQLSQTTGREAMLGAPRAECVRPPTGPEPDDADAGIDETELQRLLQSTQDEDDASVATPSAIRDAAVAPDVRRARPLRR
jgi:hypothetical protein